MLVPGAHVEHGTPRVAFSGGHQTKPNECLRIVRHANACGEWVAQNVCGEWVALEGAAQCEQGAAWCGCDAGAERLGGAARVIGAEVGRHAARCKPRSDEAGAHQTSRLSRKIRHARISHATPKASEAMA